MRTWFCFLLACKPPAFVAQPAGSAKAVVQEITRPQNNNAVLLIVDANAPTARAQSIAAPLALFAPGSAAYHVMVTTTDASDCANGSPNDGRCGRALAGDDQPAILTSEVLGDGLQAAITSRLAELPANRGVSRAFDAAIMALEPGANPGFLPSAARVIVIFISASPECSGDDDCVTLSDPTTAAAQLLALAPNAAVGAFVSLDAGACDRGDARFATFAEAATASEVATVCDILDISEDSLPQRQAFFTLDSPPADGDWSNVQVERRPLGAGDFQVLPQIASLPGTGWLPPRGPSTAAGVGIEVSPSLPGDTFRVTVFYEQAGEPL